LRRDRVMRLRVGTDANRAGLKLRHHGGIRKRAIPPYGLTCNLVLDYVSRLSIKN
jgi:hypothetical protein